MAYRYQLKNDESDKVNYTELAGFILELQFTLLLQPNVTDPRIALIVLCWIQIRILTLFLGAKSDHLYLWAVRYNIKKKLA